MGMAADMVKLAERFRGVMSQVCAAEVVDAASAPGDTMGAVRERG